MSLTDRWEGASLAVTRVRERTGTELSRGVFAGSPSLGGVIEEIGRTR